MNVKKWVAIVILVSLMIGFTDLMAWITHLSFAETGVCLIFGAWARQIIEDLDIQ